jgi:cytochrome c oxidase cbb3-type subunit III
LQIGKQVAIATAIAAMSLAAMQLMAQMAQSVPPAGGGRGAGRGAVAVRPPAYPERPPGDPAAIERGKAFWGVNCNFCHGSDARGGEGGPNLLRSELVLNDLKGELIAPVVQNGRGEMPPLQLSREQISDIAAYVHSFKVGGYDISRMTPPSILVGDAKAGEAYFKSTCASCHSVTGDLKGISSKFSDPKQLQNHFLMPGGGGRGGGRGIGAPGVHPTTVAVTLPSGEKVEGRLGRIDDFIVTLIEPDGAQRSFRRDGDSPRVEIHDPLEPHKRLLTKYTDKDIHNLTSYLETVK